MNARCQLQGGAVVPEQRLYFRALALKYWVRPPAEAGTRPTVIGAARVPFERFCVLHPCAARAGIRYGHPLRRVPGLPSDPAAIMAEGPRHKVADNAVGNNPLLTLRARRRRAKRVRRGDRSSEGTTTPPCNCPITYYRATTFYYPRFWAMILCYRDVLAIKHKTSIRCLQGGRVFCRGRSR